MRIYYAPSALQRYVAMFFLLVALSGPAVEHAMAADEQKSVIRGKVSDVEGRAVEGAMVFVYNSPDVKRAADFISTRTDKEGMYRMVLPAGKYWLIARSKSTEDYGPLMLKDRHSGDPVETELTADREVETDFVVADLMEAIKMKREERERPVKITGRIIDVKGSPVIGAYAIANRKQEIVRVPDYLSSWVDHDGHFTMYVPRGIYYIGSALSFPPGQDYLINKETVIDADTIIDMVRDTR